MTARVIVDKSVIISWTLLDFCEAIENRSMCSRDTWKFTTQLYILEVSTSFCSRARRLRLMPFKEILQPKSNNRSCWMDLTRWFAKRRDNDLRERCVWTCGIWNSISLNLSRVAPTYNDLRYSGSPKWSAVYFFGWRKFLILSETTSNSRFNDAKVGPQFSLVSWCLYYENWLVWRRSGIKRAHDLLATINNDAIIFGIWSSFDNQHWMRKTGLTNEDDNNDDPKKNIKTSAVNFPSHKIWHVRNYKIDFKAYTRHMLVVFPI